MPALMLERGATEGQARLRHEAIALRESLWQGARRAQGL
jgi:hypothetical protein